MLTGRSEIQSLFAISSGESELYATLRAAAEASGFIAMTRDMAYQVSGGIRSDAGAAPGIINRTGLGKTRHIDTGLLWCVVSLVVVVVDALWLFVIAGVAYNPAIVDDLHRGSHILFSWDWVPWHALYS